MAKRNLGEVRTIILLARSLLHYMQGVPQPLRGGVLCYYNWTLISLA